MALINPPPTDAIGKAVNGTVGILDGWRNFFQSIYTICNALTMSGTTARRPTVGLWVGRTYFDTTLGYGIWLRSINPTVWVNSAGAPV